MVPVSSFDGKRPVSVVLARWKQAVISLSENTPLIGPQVPNRIRARCVCVFAVTPAATKAFVWRAEGAPRHGPDLSRLPSSSEKWKRVSSHADGWVR